MYGSKAAAGVIIITTKRGKGGKTAISISQDLGLITARKLLRVREFTADRAVPKAGVSWNLTRSGIIKEGFFDNIKLCAAYGQANNVPAYGSKFTCMEISNIAGNPGVIVSTQKVNRTLNLKDKLSLKPGQISVY